MATAIQACLCYNHMPMEEERFNHLLDTLNAQQKDAVTAAPGAVIVLAGPGSGKTRVLTYRIAYLIEQLRVSPYQILAVTFTNKAAREMEHRVLHLVGEKAKGITLGTFHAICAQILRREAEHLPFNSNFTIFDEDDQLNVVKTAIQELNLDDKRYRPHSVHSAISNAKNELLLPDEYPVNAYGDEIIRRIYQRYQELLLINNALDFDDLLLWCAYLLEQNPQVRAKYAKRYVHILVDEFQDTNYAQYIIVKHLAEVHRSLFVVGDADQSIYRWRGADFRNVLRFERDFPEAQLILLEQNYRSTQNILNVAMAVIDRHPHRHRKRLFSDLGEGHKVIVHEAWDDRLEASFVVETILDLVMKKEASPGDIAVMYRTNAQSRLLEEAFLQMGMPYKLVGAQRFYGRREIKDLIAYLRLIYNPADEVSLTRIINVPTRGIGTKTYLSLKNLSQKLRLSCGELILAWSEGQYKDEFNEQFRNVALHALAEFAEHLRKWRANKDQFAPADLLDEVIEDIDYYNYINDKTEEGQDRWDNVLELRRLATEFQDLGLEAFLQQVALVSDQDTLEVSESAPTLLTLHAAKGLEFPIVFIVGLIDGILPHVRSFEDEDAMLEERRLFYVGITRAKERLYLVYPLNRRSYGTLEPVEPSRYVVEIPLSFLEASGTSMSSHVAPGLSKPDTRHAPSQALDKKPSQPQYRPGMRVLHPSWGEGMVLNSSLQGDDEILDIFFEKIGLKRVVASLARLEPVKS